MKLHIDSPRLADKSIKIRLILVLEILISLYVDSFCQNKVDHKYTKGRP